MLSKNSVWSDFVATNNYSGLKLYEDASPSLDDLNRIALARHGKGVNLAVSDGHVEQSKWHELGEYNWQNK